MEILGLIAAIVMGLVLGLVGGGGSILTVPILVYLLGVDPVEATAYSLFVVGLSALIGSADYIRRGLVDFKVGSIFTVPAFLGVYGVRRFGMPNIPDTIDLSVMVISKGVLILTVFAVIMLVAAYTMIRGRKETHVEENKKLNLPLIAVEGLVVGGVTGFVGAGGGFLIIPALVVLAGLEMKVAVGTSLLIIGIKSLLGFVGDLQVLESIDWALLTRFTALSVIGIFIGAFISRLIPGEKLKPAFGWFVLIIGGAMLIQQLM
ncbi:MAG: sulfite exporter TauE/SafE family protein [Pseudobdellovibrionaceae bacterium]|nr:sulfite exporter TauE/SafE family protein [Bdellovibrionales bacterium]USN46311.1 MAG: sulfite exporter TauE/SafE family protein [Pseudobdellovibrionaceae bacterium]